MSGVRVRGGGGGGRRQTYGTSSEFERGISSLWPRRIHKTEKNQKDAPSFKKKIGCTGEGEKGADGRLWDQHGIH